VRTKASLAGHPAHAGLVHLPVGLLVGGVGFDLFGIAFELRELWQAAAYLLIAGMGATPLAAVPGIVDLIFIPAGERGLRVSVVRHAAAAAAALATFALSWWIRGGIHERPSTLALGTEVAASVLLGLGDLLGGSLVFKHRVGVR
jgi:uncharacterized membrane protein